MPKSTRARQVVKPISKSDFKLGLNCLLKLKHKRDGLPSTDGDNEMLRLISEGGGAVEALLEATAPADFTGPDGGAEAAEPCMHAIAEQYAAVKQGPAGTSRVMREVTIVQDGFLARIDGLKLFKDRIEIIEQKSSTIEGITASEHDSELYVKSATRVDSNWAEYFQDLAFQVELLRRWLAAHGERLGIPVATPISPFFMLIAKESVAGAHDCLSNFRSRYRLTDTRVHADVTHTGARPVSTTLLVKVDAQRGITLMARDAQAKEASFAGKGIADCMDLMAKVLSSGSWPAPRSCIGRRCRSCEYRVSGAADSGFVRCWDKEPTRADHVLALTRLSDDQYLEAVARAEPADASLCDISQRSLTASQVQQWNVARSGVPWVDPAFAADPLAAMQVKAATPHVAFLDFETAGYPIPARVGGRPYEYVPFQWEAHMLPRADSPLTDRIGLPGFLDLTSADPRRNFVAALKKQLAHASVVFHWTPFERTVLRKIRESLLADAAAGRAQRNDQSLIDTIDMLLLKLVDLCAIAKKSFLHPDQQGRHSIKRVLPVVWTSNAIRAAFAAGAAPTDSVSCDAATDPYAELPGLAEPFLKAVGGGHVLDQRDTMQREAGLSNGGAASLYFHYARYFAAGRRPEIIDQFRRYCRLDSAAMVMVYGFMRSGCVL